jgi:hypothetical protein
MEENNFASDVVGLGHTFLLASDEYVQLAKSKILLPENSNGGNTEPPMFLEKPGELRLHKPCTTVYTSNNTTPVHTLQIEDEIWEIVYDAKKAHPAKLDFSGCKELYNREGSILLLQFGFVRSHSSNRFVL